MHREHAETVFTLWLWEGVSTFVLAELLPRQLLWRRFWSSHSPCTPACAPVTVSQTKYFTFVISVDVRTSCGLGCVFNMSLMENREFCYNILIHSILLSPRTGSSLLLLTSTGCLACHPIMGCTAYFKVRGKASISVESLTGFAFPISLNQEVLQLELLTFRLFFSLPHICSPCYYRNWTHCWENDS